MMTKLISLTVLFLVGSGVIAFGHREPPATTEFVQDQDPKQESADQKSKLLDNTPFMMRKLEAAKNIVAGLAMEDYEMIAKSASDLNLLSMESQWEVFETDYYIRMSNEFRDSSVRLRDNAREKNLDGATLAYFEVTLNCVRCHKYIRTSPQ